MDLRASLHQPGEYDMGVSCKCPLTKAQASVQLSSHAQQNIKAQIEEILMQSKEF
jgi:hypothetical protein